MTLTFETRTHNTGSGHPDDDIEVSVAIVETGDDLIELREQHVDWHEDSLRILRYPSSVIGEIGHTFPKVAVTPPVTIGKDPAGNFGIHI